MSKIIILTEGKSNPTDAKTATGVIRYRRDDIVAVYDTTQAGKTCEEVLGVGGDLPIVGSLENSDADTLLLGIAPAGGQLPDAWRQVLRDAMNRGMNIVSGLHTFLSDDDELAALAAERGVNIHDVRKAPAGLEVSSNQARNASCFRVHTVGHDCGVGKMLVALELTEGLKKRGRKTEFIATGQTGIMISGSGVPIDAVVSDFISGAVEQLVLERQDQEFVCIEGQGSLVHPLYSGVTLGLLHGCAPQAMVLCIDPRREEIRHCDAPMPLLEDVVDTYERMANFIAPSQVVALALNTHGMSEGDAEEQLQRAQETTGLIATDVIRYGVEPIVEVLLALEAESRRVT